MLAEADKLNNKGRNLPKKKDSISEKANPRVQVVQDIEGVMNKRTRTRKIQGIQQSKNKIKQIKGNPTLEK